MNTFSFKASELKLSYTPKVKASERVSINHSKEVYDLLINNFFDKRTIEHKEYFKIVVLNRANKVMGVHAISEGGIDATIVDIRIIMQVCLLSNCTSLILSHNHPSGNIQPSIQDKRITEQIKQACKVVDIQLLDHIILTSDTYYSFADEGII